MRDVTEGIRRTKKYDIIQVTVLNLSQNVNLYAYYIFPKNINDRDTFVIRTYKKILKKCIKSRNYSIFLQTHTHTHTQNIVLSNMTLYRDAI